MEQQIDQMDRRMKQRPYIESATNENGISAGASATEAVKLRHKGGFPLLVRGFTLSYNGSAQAVIKVALKDNSNDVYIITEGTIIANVGHDRTSFAARSIRPVSPNVLLRSGQDWTLIVWTSVNIAVDDLCLSLDGEIQY